MMTYSRSYFYTGILVCLFALAACKSGKNSQSATADLPASQPVIRMEKGPCMGTCPVFALDIYEGGRVDFFPRLYTRVDTMATARWEVGPIVALFENSGFSEFQDEYLVPIADLPTYTLRYHDKVVKWNAGAPEQLLALMVFLDELAGREGWLHLDMHPED